MVLNQLPHVGPVPHHRLGGAGRGLAGAGEGGGALVGRPRGNPSVDVPEEDVPGLQGGGAECGRVRKIIHQLFSFKNTRQT